MGGGGGGGATSCKIIGDIAGGRLQKCQIKVREGEVPALRRSIEVDLRNVMVACALKVHYADYCQGCSKRTFTLISNRRLDLYSF